MTTWTLIEKKRKKPKREVTSHYVLAISPSTSHPNQCSITALPFPRRGDPE